MADYIPKIGEYRVIRTSGEDFIIHEKPTLNRVKKSIGADYIDCVTISFSAGHVADLVMMVDDTGMIDGKPLNGTASIVAGTDIYGDAAIIHDCDFA